MARMGAIAPQWWGGGDNNGNNWHGTSVTRQKVRLMTAMSKHWL
jgi:hypothetical protein